MRRFLTLMALALGFAPPAAAQGPSFDCAAARTPTEFAICADRSLSRLDVVMVDAYRAARADARIAEKIAEDQSVWRRWRNTCLADQACLTRRYEARIVDLTLAAGLPVVEPVDNSDQDGVITRVNGNRFERVYPDGTIRWTEIGGVASGTIFPDGSVSLFSPIQVGGADMPTLPGNATPWVSEIEARLISIVNTHLPLDDHAEYEAIQSGFPLAERVIRHIDAISFLTFRSVQ